MIVWDWLFFRSVSKIIFMDEFLFFTISKWQKHWQSTVQITKPCGLCSFWSLYDRPSQTKVEIYEEWEKVLNDVYGCTGSKHAFTIYWNVKDEKDGQIYDVRISKSHNYLM